MAKPKPSPEAAERLRLAREKAGFTSAAAAASHFRFKGPTYSSHENGNRGFMDYLDRYAKAFQVNAEWLRSGHGAAGKYFGDEPTRVQAEGVENDVKRTLFTTTLKEIDVQASMGGGAIVEVEKTEGEWGFPTGWLRSELRGRTSRKLYVITVEGDSMKGTLDDGDKVLIDTERLAPSPPGLFILHDGVALVAKRLEFIEGSEPARVRIISDNARYQAYERTVDEMKIVGRVVARWQRL